MTTSEEQSVVEPYVVVVGVSATSKSPTALIWAAAQAKQNNGTVIAVRAWRMPNPPATPSGPSAGRIAVPHDVEAEALATLEQDVAAALGDDHAAQIRLIRGGRFNALIKAARDADLLVVDAPRQLLIGPMFAHRLIYAAPCPVIVMPPGISGEPASVMSRMAGALGRGIVTAAGTAVRPGWRPPMVR